MFLYWLMGTLLFLTLLPSYCTWKRSILSIHSYPLIFRKKPSIFRLQTLSGQACSLFRMILPWSSIQPFQNDTAVNYIEEKINSDEKFVWTRYHIGKGFAALEKLLKGSAGRYDTGEEVFLSKFPLLCRLNKVFNELPEFRAAMLEMQPDFEKL